MLMWVHSTVTHLCWQWLKFINGGHPTPDISWISVLPGNFTNLSFSPCIFFLNLFIIFLPFQKSLFSLQGFYEWEINFCYNVNTAEESSSTYTLASVWCSHGNSGRKPVAGDENSQHKLPYAGTYACMRTNHIHTLSNIYTTISIYR